MKTATCTSAIGIAALSVTLLVTQATCEATTVTTGLLAFNGLLALFLVVLAVLISLRPEYSLVDLSCRLGAWHYPPSNCQSPDTYARHDSRNSEGGSGDDTQDTNSRNTQAVRTAVQHLLHRNDWLTQVPLVLGSLARASGATSATVVTADDPTLPEPIRRICLHWPKDQQGPLHFESVRGWMTGHLTSICSTGDTVLSGADLDLPATVHASLDRFGIASFLLAPIRQRDRVSGLIAMFHTSQSHRWSDTDGDSLWSIASIIGSRLHSESSNNELPYDLVTKSTQDWEFCRGPWGDIRLMSPACMKVTGYDIEEFADRPQLFFEIIHEDDRVKVLQHFTEQLKDDEPHSIEFRIMTKDGTLKWIEHRCHPVYDVDHEFAGRRTVNRDITEIRDTIGEQQRLLVELTKCREQETLHLMIGGLAHDLSNMLTAILGNVNIALDDLPADSEIRERLERTVHITESAAGFIDQMLAHVGKGHLRTNEFDLSQLADDTARVIETMLPKGATLRRRLSSSPVVIKADRIKIQQIIMNLLTNASQSLTANRGVITVRTDVLEISQQELDTCHYGKQLLPGSYALVEISDTGRGMTDETIARIFDPFFTTRPEGRGLGLASILQIIKEHKSALKVESEPGVGSCFRIYLPVAVKVPNKLELDNCTASTDTGTSSTRRRAILLVDDDSVVRELGSTILRRAGYEVHVARNGLEAVERYRSLVDQIAAVVLDMTMPLMGGEEVLKELKRINSCVKVLICSGLRVAELENKLAGLSPAGYLRKPYRAQTLLSKIETILQ
ncbi:PAS domain-containing protein [candidate division GN15 bacterium]|nr:PAS domain-containing protein [candidate division GN15 bacterium]